jgi:hypothetical protein
MLSLKLHQQLFVVQICTSIKETFRFLYGQAEYLRVPFGNYTPFLIPENCELEDEQLLFLSDVLKNKSRTVFSMRLFIMLFCFKISQVTSTSWINNL